MPMSVPIAPERLDVASMAFVDECLASSLRYCSCCEQVSTTRCHRGREAHLLWVVSETVLSASSSSSGSCMHCT